MLGTLNISLKATQLAGKLGGGTPATTIENGLMYGFLTEETADATLLPDNLPPLAALAGIKAGEPLSSVLHDDEQTELDGVKGWWFAVSYTAKTQAFEP